MHDCYYTMVPLQLDSPSQVERTASHLVCYKGIPMYVRPYNAAYCQVTDLCTTNPAYYLQKELMPGALIPYWAEMKQENRINPSAGGKL